MIKITDNWDRKKLYEGRTTGMGFAFLKKVGKDMYETIQPISACKDYLNDVIYTEHTGKPVTACGLRLEKKEGILDSTKCYMVIKILESNSTLIKTYQRDRTYEGDIEQLKTQYKKIQEFVNKIEFFDDIKTTITKVEDNSYLVTFSKEWTKTTYLISLFSFLLRIGLWWDGKMTMVEYITAISKSDTNVEKSIAQTSTETIFKIIAESSLECISTQDFNTEILRNNPSSIHNYGICVISRQHKLPKAVLV